MIFKLKLRDLGWLIKQDKECFDGPGLGAESLCNYLSKPNCYAIKADYEPKAAYIFIVKEDPEDDKKLAISGITLMVQKEYRNKGLAEELLRNAWGFTDETVDIIRNRVETTNIASVNLHKKLGFKELKIDKNYYGQNRDCVLMVRDSLYEFQMGK